ncbi:alkene reductase [Nibricoccus sp. IMCC34717]|uniref:alkene reductase n=1 Tax=Nibricoccus sp. IMCC34717 TaxID=3034021 RepID=UPI00384EBBD8
MAFGLAVMHLLTPLQMGTLSVPNRVFLSALTRARAGLDNVPGELMAQHYAQRASGGVLFTDATMVDPDGLAWPHQPGLVNGAQVEGWKRVNDAVHAAGGRIFVQLWHPGRATHAALNRGVQPVSSTDRPIRDDTIHTPQGKVPYEAPRRLGLDEISTYVDFFRKAAAKAHDAGFDGVQIHAAHGYLVDQFLRDGVNDRLDRYGGTVENRARFLFEVIDAVLTVFHPGRVGFRVSPRVGFNDNKDSNPRELVSHVAAEAERRKLGHFELRNTRWDDPEETELAKLVRSYYSGCLLRNGGFTREGAEQTLKGGLADAIVFGKAFLANPDLPMRLLKNAPLNEPDEPTFYAQGAKGYTDYPFLAP